MHNRTSAQVHKCTNAQMNNRTFAQLCKIAEAEVWIFKGFNISDDLSLILYKNERLATIVIDVIFIARYVRQLDQKR